MQNWNSPYGMALQSIPAAGLMSPLMPWGLGAMATQGGETAPSVAARGGQSMGEGEGEGRVSSPSNAMSGPTTPGEQMDRDRALGRVNGYAAEQLGKSALGIGAAHAMGMAPDIGQSLGYAASNIANPAGLSGLMGGMVADQMGFSKPTGVMGKVAQYGINPAITMGLGLVNPALAVAYGLMSPFAMDGIGDMTDTRKDENFKDSLEDAHGYFGGRSVSKDLAGMVERAGFESLAQAFGNQGLGPADIARGMTNKDATSVARGGNPMGNTYGARSGVGFTNAIGGPTGGARSVDKAYGRNMGGFAGLGIGNPSSYGGGSSDSGGKSSGGKSGGGYGGHAGDKDGSSTGFGR